MIRREKKKNKKILSDKISELLTVAPTADVEDDVVFRTAPVTVSREELVGEGEDNEEVEALSAFRKQNAKLLADISHRYAGEVTTRKELTLQDSEEEESDIEEQSDEDGVEVNSDEMGQDSGENGEESIEESLDEEEADMGEEYDSDDEEEGSMDEFNISEMNGEMIKEENNFKHFKEKDLSEELAKGRCVKNQLNIWEGLLEMRISMQKCLGTANRMPLPETGNRLKKEGGEEYNIMLNKTRGSATTLLSRLLNLQDTLLQQFPETKNLSDKDNKQNETVEDPMDEEIPSDEEISSDDSEGGDKSNKKKVKPVEKQITKVKRKRKLADYSAEIEEKHTTYSKYRNSVIQMWNDKTKAMGQKKDQSTALSVLSQIDYILRDRNKLIRRTQLKRSKYDILGEEKNEEIEKESDDNCDKPEDVDGKNLDNEYSMEIFDDDDFYHQLLRELIEYKSADISDPIQLSRQWITLQQIRSKMKRKIDTRATKGRRIRYAVHSKLVNLMAPEVNHEWTDEMKDELYASLFGKQFEDNLEDGKSKSNLKGGFKIMK